MIRFGIKALWFFGLFILLNVAVAFWILIHDLKTHFPDLDFSTARFGVASWYSETDKHINEKTANGEIFDDSKLTCASWDYPFGEKLVVINTLTGRWTVCRVNDRGPAKRLGRHIDLTKTSFKKIANLRRGLIYTAILPARGSRALKE